MKKNKTDFSKEHLLFVKKIRQNNIFIHTVRIAVLIIFFTIWELAARCGLKA